MIQSLFPSSLAERQWLQFRAAGFSQPVCGVIHLAAEPPCCGVPLGGISTGCLDLDARGVLGFSTLFNPAFPHPKYPALRYTRKLPTAQPLLALAVGEQTWVLASEEIVRGGPVAWCTDPGTTVGAKPPAPIMLQRAPISGVAVAEAIRYWGHYPVADLEYQTSAPVSVALRAWAPFVPGDAALSNIPAALFDVHLANESDRPQSGSIALSFPGPDAQEAGGSAFTRQRLEEDFTGMLVSSSGGVSYLLGVIGAEPLRAGAGLDRHPEAWARIARALPVATPEDGSCAMALDWTLAPGERRVVRFLLAWYAPVWEGSHNDLEARGAVDQVVRPPWIGSPWAGDTHYFTHMYAARYGSAVEVARRLALEHDAILHKVLAWQQAIYTEERLPVWLRESLVNNLCLIAEDSYWAQGRPPLGDWAFPGGAFGLNESPRACPHTSCIPCDWYGNLPIVLFFPELALATLRAFKHYQLETGEVPFALGRIADLPDLATPEYFWQVSLNGVCYVDMVDRLWQRTGDDAILREFYDSLVACTTFTMRLREGPGGVISMPAAGGMEWFEFGEWAGMCAHLGGLRLAQLRMMARIARVMGDAAYAAECERWLTEGTRAMEEELWADGYYLNFYEPETGKRSDDVMAYQLDGEWAARYHGLPGVFRRERVAQTLQTIRRGNIALTPQIGAANFCRPDGSPLGADSPVAAYGPYAMFCAELVILAATYAYAGEPEFGLDLARRHWENLVCRQGHPFDLPNMVRGDTGERFFGTDYYQAMMLWALPAAAAGDDLRSSCGAGSLVERVLQAGRG